MPYMVFAVSAPVGVAAVVQSNCCKSSGGVSIYFYRVKSSSHMFTAALVATAIFFTDAAASGAGDSARDRKSVV